MKKKKFKSLLSITASLVTGAILGVLLAEFVPNSSVADYVWVILFMTAGLLLQIIIHELGHCVCALISGYKFVFLSILNIMFVKIDGKLKVKKVPLKVGDGQCIMDPPDCNNFDYPFILYHLGGILFNLISSLLFGFLYFVSIEYYISRFFICISLIGAAMVILNGIPRKFSGTGNDGLNTIMLHRDKQTRKALWNQCRTIALMRKGMKIKDLPDYLFDMGSVKYDNPIVNGIGIMKCSREMDKKNFDKAGEIAQYMLENAEGLSDIEKYILMLENTFCELIGENRKDVVDSMYTDELKKFIKSCAKFISVIRFNYAYYLLYENDTEKAEKQLILFEKAAKTYPHESELISERELLKYINEIYESKRSLNVE